MKIYTLGTSHGNSTFDRFNTSTAYETADGTIYLVDAGAPVEALMRRRGLEIRNLKAAFITHMHDDHAGGLSGLIKQVTKYPAGRTEKFSLYLPEERAIDALRNWVLALHEPADSPIIHYGAVDDGEIYSDENLLVTAIRTRHLCTRGRTEGEPCSFAYVLHFKKEKYTVLHTGDLRHDFIDFPEIAFRRDFDLCLCEATHYKPEVAMDSLMRARFRRLLFIHIVDRWHNYVKECWNVENGEKALLDAFSSLPYPVAVAHDGDVFDTEWIM